jgi:NADH-quinone oxidoreductase subunit I
MGYFIDGFRSLSVSMKNVFRRPTTVEYPKEKRERAERYRNSFALLHDEHGEECCIGCSLCAEICPSDVITVVAGPKKESPTTGKKRGTSKDFTLDLNACIFCELCVQVCPSDAIVMRSVAEQPAYSREDLCLTMEKLYANETAKPGTWATGSLLRDMQNPKGAKGAKKKPAKKAEPKAKPEAKEKAKPAAKAEEKPAAKAEEKPAAKAEEKPAAKAEEKPEAKAEEKPEAKAEEKPEAKEEAKPAGTGPLRTPSGRFVPPTIPPPPTIGKPEGGKKE